MSELQRKATELADTLDRMADAFAPVERVEGTALLQLRNALHAAAQRARELGALKPAPAPSPLPPGRIRIAEDAVLPAETCPRCSARLTVEHTSRRWCANCFKPEAPE